MRWSEAIAATIGTVTRSFGTRRKKLQQCRDACLLETDDDGFERGVISHFLDRSTIPAGSILENASVSGDYESGTEPSVEHERVMLAQKRVTPTIWLRLPKLLQEVIGQMEPHGRPSNVPRLSCNRTGKAVRSGGAGSEPEVPGHDDARRPTHSALSVVEPSGVKVSFDTRQPSYSYFSFE